MHHMDTDNTYRGKARLELQKNATSYIEQFLEETPCETTAFLSLTRRIQKHPHKMNKTYGVLLEKQEKHISNFFLWMPSYEFAIVGRPQKLIYNSSVRREVVV